MQVTNDTSFHLEVVNWHVAVTSTEISKCLNKCLQDLSILGNDVRTFFNFPLSQEAKYSSWQSIKSLYVSLSNSPFLIIKLSLPRNAERKKKEISPRKKTITNLINIYIDFNDIDYFQIFANHWSANWNTCSIVPRITYDLVQPTIIQVTLSSVFWLVSTLTNMELTSSNKAPHELNPDTVVVVVSHTLASTEGRRDWGMTMMI